MITFENMPTKIINGLKAIVFLIGIWLGSFGAVGQVAQSSWEWQYLTPTGNGIRDVFFLNNELGWAVGASGTIIRTTKNGIFWKNHSIGSFNTLFSVYFVNDSVGWVIGDNGTTLKSTDGGTNWDSQLSGTNSQLNSIHFLDLQNRFVRESLT